MIEALMSNDSVQETWHNDNSDISYQNSHKINDHNFYVKEQRSEMSM